ncbi:hypothetical protein B0H17DRAFT_433999 [Mycena rosella]|uniref:Aminoglycoside phosphotransferase domain-containing protein n=1 Tax=Mycena rosella TaxID=1033263 RepID=A0AAD7DNG4_MYCRO|nr:hypothetical protein B0H17DRAFT_433999 [Mycena rosella]
MDQCFIIPTRQSAWIKAHAGSAHARSQPGAEDSPDAHLAAYNTLLKLAPYVFPSESELTKPILNHPDFSLSNILVDGPEATRTGILDCTFRPLFKSFIIPKMFEIDMLWYMSSSIFRAIQQRTPRAPPSMPLPEDQKIMVELEKLHARFLAVPSLYASASRKRMDMEEISSARPSSGPRELSWLGNS